LVINLKSQSQEMKLTIDNIVPLDLDPKGNDILYDRFIIDQITDFAEVESQTVNGE